MQGWQELGSAHEGGELTYLRPDHDALAWLVASKECAVMSPPVKIPLHPSLLTEAGTVCEPAALKTFSMLSVRRSAPRFERWSRQRNGAARPA